MNQLAPNTDLAYYKSIGEWAPRVGDNIVWHGWLTHWFGVVSGIAPDGTVSIIKAGLPVLLVTLTEPAMVQNTINVHLSEIRQGVGGKYSVVQAHGNNLIWYV